MRYNSVKNMDSDDPEETIKISESKVNTDEKTPPGINPIDLEYNLDYGSKRQRNMSRNFGPRTRLFCETTPVNMLSQNKKNTD